MNLLTSLKSVFAPGPRVEPAEAVARVRAGDAVLIDVREPNEWSSGVAENAALLPLSDLTGARAQWSAFLAKTKNRELLVYCASGMRSGRAVQLLSTEGFRAANVGGIGNLVAAGWPIVKPA